MSLKGLYFDLVQSQLAGKEETSEENRTEDTYAKENGHDDFKRQISRQMSRLSNAGKTASPDEEAELQTSRFKLLGRLMKLSVPELPYIIIG